MNRSWADTIIAAAVVVVILPLLATVAAVCASFGVKLTGDTLVGMFGPLGLMHVVILAWTIAAVVIVASLIAVVKDGARHA
jgi:hypothetical protein